MTEFKVGDKITVFSKAGIHEIVSVRYVPNRAAVIRYMTVYNSKGKPVKNSKINTCYEQDADLAIEFIEKSIAEYEKIISQLKKIL